LKYATLSDIFIFYSIGAAMKLYKSQTSPQQWIAYVPGTGWIAFPARENGWDERHPARGLDPLHLRQVPLELAVNTGMPVDELAQVA
jgi:hypothetical protein